MITGLSLNATYKAVQEGQIHALKIGGRWIIPDPAIERMLTDFEKDD